MNLITKKRNCNYSSWIIAKHINKIILCIFGTINLMKLSMLLRKKNQNILFKDINIFIFERKSSARG